MTDNGLTRCQMICHYVYVAISLKNLKLKGFVRRVVSEEKAEYEVAGISNPGNVAHTQPPTHTPKPPPFSPFSVLRLLQSLQPPLMGFIYDVATPPCVRSPFVAPSFLNPTPSCFVPNE